MGSVQKAAKTFALLGFIGAMAAPLHAQEIYPSRQVTIVVPLAPGGGTDTQARLLAKGLIEKLNHPFIVVNKPGANGFIGAQFLNDSRPDGYTLMIQSAGSFILAGLMRPQSLDPMADFTPVAQIGELSTSIIVKSDGPYKSLNDLIADAKARPGMVRWSHNGRGSFHHIAGVGFAKALGLEMRDVPFDGGGPSRAAVVGGTVEFGFLGIQQLTGFETQLNSLGLVSEKRDPAFPEVATLQEQGSKVPLVTSPTVIYAPKGTPEDVVETIGRHVQAVVESPAYAAEMTKLSLSVAYRGPKETSDYLARLKEEATPVVQDIRQSSKD